MRDPKSRMESSIDYDALIIGGGPGGSTTATFLARAGKKVLLLEKERFPRFHIGESLLPYNHTLFEELGVLPAFEAAGFTRKWGAQFHVGNGSKTLHLVFRNGRFTREPLAFQVERATFDHILLKNARAAGADVRDGWTVTKTQTSPPVAEVEASGPEGQSHRFRGAFLVDASGRSNLTGNQSGQRVIHERLRKVAVFGHFAGVTLDPDEKAGDTIIVRMEDKWFWIIPLLPDKVSVGCVLDQDALARLRQSPEQVFNRLWQSSLPLRQRMRNARLLGPMRTASDFSYHNRRLVGPRLVRVGDAAGFMDPIFSAGVYLAMFSGKLAANLVVESLAAGDDGRARLRRYEKRFSRAMRLYWRMVEGFYTAPFFEVFMEPRHRLSLPAAVTAVLGGELEGGWRIWWRLRLFYMITRVQAFWPLLPRISFEAGKSLSEAPQVRHAAPAKP
ncbi:MAG: NAD(P)/FAD-dependent oxidoreductase [Verrucomicrobiota bacterium]